MVLVLTRNFYRIYAKFQLWCKGTLVFRPPLRDDEREGYLSQRKGGEEELLILGFWFHRKRGFSHSFAMVHRVE